MLCNHLYVMLFFCYIALVVKNKIGNINAVCEVFIISETHDAYTFIVESLFKMSISRRKETFYVFFSDEFLTRSILDSINMNNVLTFL